MRPEDVDQMGLQGFMDFAVKKIVEQGQRCTNGAGCAYGATIAYPGQPTLHMHCAVGWGLDENDKDLMNCEGGVVTLVDRFGASGRIPKLIGKSLDAMERLQQFHDCLVKDDREHHMRKLRKKYGIDTSGPHWQQWVDMGTPR